MQKTRRLVDEMFLILLSFIALGSESQISVFSSSNVKAILRCLLLLFLGEHAQKPKLGDFSEKNPAYSTSNGSISRVFH